MSTIENPDQYLADHYRRLYCKDKHDSPNKSRQAMAREMRDCMATQPLQPGRILELGSGPQALLKHLISFAKPLLKDVQYVTVDIAPIDISRLLVIKSLVENGIFDINKPLKSKVIHMQANGAHIPFADNAMGMLVSNMALDFMPPQTLTECARVLHPGGPALFNIHHPSMIADSSLLDAQPRVRAFWEYLKENHVLFENKDQIAHRLSQAGLTPQVIEEQADKHDVWWHVSATKMLH